MDNQNKLEGSDHFQHENTLNNNLNSRDNKIDSNNNLQNCDQGLSDDEIVTIENSKTKEFLNKMLVLS